MKESDTEAACTIYHNPRCSKSRATLELIEERGVPIRVIEYLKSPPSVAELTAIVRRLGLKPIDLMRRGEPEYAEKVHGKKLSDAQMIALMVDNPILIERPIVVVGDRAAICRPPEKVLQLLK